MQVLQTLITNNQYQYQLDLFFISSWVVPTTIPGSSNPDADPGGYITDVRIAFNAQFPCVRQDGLVILRNGSAHGHGSNGVGGVLLGNGFINGANRAAHELGHLIGLVHCCPPCPDCAPTECGLCEASVMCSSNTQEFFKQSCEIKAMNNEVMSAGNCSHLLDVQTPLPDNFTCPIIPVPAVSIISDQPYLLEASKGCTPDRSLSMYQVSIFNSTGQTINDAKIEVRYNNKVYDVDLNTMNMDFNHDAPVSGSSELKALTIWDNGLQQTFSLTPQETKIFYFKILYQPDAGFQPINSNAQVEARLTYTGGSLITRKSSPQPMKIVSGSGDWFFDIQRPVFVSENAIITAPGNVELAIQSPFILVASGKSIQVGDGEVVKTTQYATTIAGCNNMWAGFTMGTNSRLEIDNMTIKDAQKAIEARRGTVLKVINSRFYNNNYGIFTGGSTTTGAYNITLAGNEFGTLASGLRPAYTGQSPVPNGNKGFAGIYANMNNTANMLYPLNIIADPNTGNTNRFFNLKYGILSYSSILMVKDAEFSDIAVGPGGSGYPGPGITGRAIYAQNSTLVVDGADFLSPKVRFSNCGVGVETENCKLTTAFTKMDHMGTGVSVLSATNRSTSIYSNTIQAEKYGIKVDNTSGLAVRVGFNVLNITDMFTNIPPLKGGVGIDLANCTTPYQQLNAYNNTVNVIDGIAGIRLRNNTNVWAYDNDATLSNSSLRSNYGLLLEAGNSNLFSCNRTNVTGTGSGSSGLYLLHADRSALLCNTAQAGGYGLHFEGALTGEASSDIAANTMSENAIGLYYGEGAITGPQTHRGNKWRNTGAQHAGGATLAPQSLYTVDAAENPLFFPNIVIPTEWFDNLPNPGTAPSCPTSNCIPIRPNPKADMDRKIAKGELLAGDYTAATNWLAQRRLLTRLITEGNPYPNDRDFDGFLQTAQGSGLDGYANIQVGIRQLLALGQANTDSLKAWENQAQTHIDNIEYVDKLLAKKGLTPADSADYLKTHTLEAQALASVEASRQTKLSALQSARLTLIPGLMSSNSALVGTAYYQQYEKAVNEIFLQTVASGVNVFTPAQQTLLETIAQQCPLSRGEAVLRARALLSLVQQQPVDYDDITNCLPANRDAGHPVLTSTLRIFPNPASDLLTIDYPGTEPAALDFFNALGQQVMRLQLVGQEIRQLDLSALQSGIYWYVLQPNNQSTVTGKILISK